MTNSGAAGLSEAMSPIALFMQADIVVKSVMVGLILASIWTWAIIIGHMIRMGRIWRGNRRFEADFWRAEDIDRFYDARGKEDVPSAKVFSAGILEWRRSTAGARIDKEGTRSRGWISEAAATAPGWSNREPAFFPEWVEKVDVTVAG